MWHANSGVNRRKDSSVRTWRSTSWQPLQRGLPFQQRDERGWSAEQKKGDGVMRCFCFWSPFMTVRPWSCLKGGNFMWKIVVLRQLSVPEMMEETSSEAIDTMSGCKICLLLSVGTNREHLFVLINESAHLNAHFFDLCCRTQANILWNEWPLTYWHYLMSSSSLKRSWGFILFFKGVHVLNVPLKLVQVPFEVRLRVQL